MNCRFCNSKLKHVFADLGKSPIANSYLKGNEINKMEPFYPLCAYICSKCFLVQVDEFEKAGFTPVKSEKVNPFRVKESPVNFECKVNEVIALGKEGGAGNLVICEVLKIHIDESILDEDENIDPLKLGALSRLGGNWYAKATKNSLFQLKKPIGKIGMGFDNLPNELRASSILSGSDLAILASLEEIPAKTNFSQREGKKTAEKHTLAKKYLSQGSINDAWQILL